MTSIGHAYLTKKGTIKRIATTQRETAPAIDAARSIRDGK